MPNTVSTATESDVTGCSQVLAEAFADDPLMAAIWPEAEERHRALPRYFAASLRHFHIPAGGVQIASDPGGNIGGVAVWDPPGRWDQGLMQTMRAVPDLLPALRLRAGRAITVRRTLDGHHPANAHWYLANIGTPLSHRGQGFAAQLLQHRLDSAAGTPSYLVCTRAENVAYYERFGFKVTETFSLAIGNKPKMWAMQTGG
ncbi:GNAT family N-acetyltransferase [Nocardia salmonicida]|uniref:GNAT family N-acetyltransferase n=1 Tax=Nocardia salmonicida TaxID=53431 RepID=UPI0007A45145|nr:GNAT family N-acetyltransferase [Nocardia salmonicida]MBC7299799.1 GNAT family N-acetyltransferase [Nocardia sp.]